MPKIEIGKDYWAKTNFYTELHVEFNNPTEDLDIIFCLTHA